MFATTARQAKRLDKEEAKLPKTQKILLDVDVCCIAVTADLFIIPIGKNIDNTQYAFSR